MRGAVGDEYMATFALVQGANTYILWHTCRSPYSAAYTLCIHDRAQGVSKCKKFACRLPLAAAPTDIASAVFYCPRQRFSAMKYTHTMLKISVGMASAGLKALAIKGRSTKNTKRRKVMAPWEVMGEAHRSPRNGRKGKVPSPDPRRTRRRQPSHGRDVHPHSTVGYIFGNPEATAVSPMNLPPIAKKSAPSLLR